ncbi:DUF2493 domain-containing protein [Campylobacter coli]|uniref:DUF2493 domain-containing protein n=1 Tax=Campylobacter coli TaxID=195 RepID=UPI000257DBDB|nr:DUF2493 domain-containing protein [Campylobacter coli]EAH6629751.1 DUF2493 domain-containing protein [Campylobacter jejuni]EIA75238.1 hypothetical protein cco5_05361 [Campylobacter coli 132-6]HEE6703166.1 DUF2493 domain-containing protein [Campylobacter jejuni subsp. jejuni]ALU99743.1 hypothetical protein ATE51_02450 [Campylobacter coli]ALU99956.1 hypothetical protein ATE51_02876 [Campylobacter coli]
MKLLVCGGRDYTDIEHFNKEMDNVFSLYQNQIDTIIEGGARGADNMAKNYALKNKINLVEVKADWQHFGKAAGPIRNQRMLSMLDSNDCVLAFWNGVSKGTKNMIEIARNKNIKVIIINIK